MSGKELITKKALVGWKTVCEPKSVGGLGVIELRIWNKVTLLKLLWNICEKADKLWIQWIHIYYFKGGNVQEFEGRNCSWLLRRILKNKNKVRGLKSWDQTLEEDKFPTGKIYRNIRGQRDKVHWRKLFFGNLARPRGKFIYWLACHGNYARKAGC